VKIPLAPAPSILVKLAGRTVAQVICTVVTLSVYLLIYRLLDAYAPFEVDPIFYFVFVILFHFGLATYVWIQGLEE
jgi:hypothetical protein